MNKKAQKAKAIADAKAIQSLAKSEGRELLAEEVKSINAFLDTAEALQAEIALDEVQAEALADAASTNSRLDAALDSVDSPVADVKSLPETAVVESVRENALDDPTYGFKSMGDFAMAVYNSNPNVNNGVARHKGLDICAAASGMNQTNPSGS